MKTTKQVASQFGVATFIAHGLMLTFVTLYLKQFGSEWQQLFIPAVLILDFPSSLILLVTAHQFEVFWSVFGPEWMATLIFGISIGGVQWYFVVGWTVRFLLRRKQA